MPVPPHSRFVFWEKAPAMEGLIPPGPVSPPLTAVISHFPPELFPRADERCRVGDRERLPALGAACPGCPALEHCWLGSGAAEGHQGSSTASSLIH